MTKEQMVALQCCEKHWGMLRTSIKNAGMEHLVSTSTDHCQKVLEEAEEKNEWPTDPLLQAFAMMATEVMNQGVPSEVLDELKGCICPICVAIKMTNQSLEEVEQHWTDGLAKSVLDDFRKRGLVPRLQ